MYILFIYHLFIYLFIYLFVYWLSKLVYIWNNRVCRKDANRHANNVYRFLCSVDRAS